MIVAREDVSNSEFLHDGYAGQIDEGDAWLVCILPAQSPCFSETRWRDVFKLIIVALAARDDRRKVLLGLCCGHQPIKLRNQFGQDVVGCRIASTTRQEIGMPSLGCSVKLITSKCQCQPRPSIDENQGRYGVPYK